MFLNYISSLNFLYTTGMNFACDYESNEVRTASANRVDVEYIASKTDALRMELILRKVLSNLSTKDLLSCSLVSHHWKNEARFILRNQRACLCKLKVACSCCHTCDQDLGIQKAFKDNENLPFSGLSFSMEIGQFRNCFCSLCSTFPSWVESFLNQVRVKYLKIRWKGERDHPMIHLLTKTLSEKSSEIEELIIAELPTTLVNGSFKETLMLDRISLPRLKTINLPSDGASLMASMGDLISAATSLNEITGWVYPRDVLSVGLKLASVKNFWIRASHHNEAVYQIVAQHPPKLTSLAISTKYLNQTPSPHRLLETVKLLLLSSRESLEELQVELAVLLEIKTFNFLPFPRVKRIQLEYRSSSDSRLLYSIDFSSMFPNLAASSFTITAGSTLTRFPIKLNALEAKTRALYHPMVSALEIYPSVLQSFPFESMPLFFSIFNNVRSYRATRIKNMADHLNSLWKFCPHLESISFVLRPHELFFNIDWILCGISLSEVELLLGKSPEFLSNYHYAAIQPCVMSFSKLRRFRLEIEHENCWCYSCQEKDRIITPVSIFLMVKKMPHLRFEISRNICDCDKFPCNFSFDHLEPEVKLTNGMKNSNI